MTDINETIAQRAYTHGEFRLVAAVSQSIKDAMRSGPQWNQMKPAQKESLEMIATKLARCVCGDSTEPDHLHDVTGYSRLYLLNIDGDENELEIA